MRTVSASCSIAPDSRRTASGVSDFGLATQDPSAGGVVFGGERPRPGLSTHPAAERHHQYRNFT